MPDDPINKGPADAKRVNVNEPHEVRYWCEKFNCTEEELRNAVRRAGVMVDKIRAYFGG
jgi:hypothetical protein